MCETLKAAIMNTEAIDKSCNLFDPICLEIDKSLEAINRFQRKFFPFEIASIREELFPFKNSLEQAKHELNEKSITPDQNERINIIDNSANLILETFKIIFNSSTTDFQNTMIQVMKAFRKICRAQENLYAIRTISPHLNRFFLEPSAYNQIETLDPKPNRAIQTGLIHEGVKDSYYARGAMSMYIPESYDGTKPWPLVIALHGGFGHGRDFIWAWLREARSRKFLLLSPTSLDTTWSLLNPKLDGTALYKMLDHVKNNWQIDPHRILLTGISDGGTFALVCSMQKDTPFTAFAPVACTLPPMDISHAKGKRILWIHGALDWMFPVHTARAACEMLKMAEADITLHMVDDLSHTYPRDKNDLILNWFDSTLALPEQHLV